MTEIAIVKIGVRGSLIRKENMLLRIPAIRVNSVDTTGAGDFYASGILFGLSKGLELDKSGVIGAYVAGKAVELVGARLDNVDKTEISKIINR